MDKDRIEAIDTMLRILTMQLTDLHKRVFRMEEDLQKLQLSIQKLMEKAYGKRQ